jgi:hypothetical protein
MPLNESVSNTTVQYTVTTTNTADGTTLYWKTTGNTTNADIVGGNTGSIVVTNNRAVFNVTVIADSMTEGDETIGISILTGSISGTPVVNTSSLITINDTSVTPAPYIVEFMIIGGGGGGGGSGGTFGIGGAGGAGGLVLGSKLITPGNTFTFTIGSGGAGSGADYPSPQGANGFQGANTTLSTPSITTITALGGGKGSSGGNLHGTFPGGSGGGGTGAPYPSGGVGGLGIQPSQNSGNPAVVAQYGYPGASLYGPSDGASGGGAGGAGLPGAVSGANAGGGSGYTWPITGLAYGRGGNTASVLSPFSSGNAAGAPGTPGRGDGGQAGNRPQSGGAGGDGAVVFVVPSLMYPGSAPGAVVTTPPAAPGKTVLTYGSSGTFTA